MAITRKIKLFRRTHYFKGKLINFRWGRSLREQVQVDKLIATYWSIADAREALTFLQNQAKDCSYWLQYPQSAINMLNANRKEFYRAYGGQASEKFHD